MDASNTSLVPQTPSGLIGSAYDNAADLRWNAVSGATSYNVKRSRSSGGPFVTVDNTLSTPHRCIDLLNGSTYYFKVSAVNYYGQSGESSVVAVTPAKRAISAAPSNLHLVTTSDNPPTPNSLVVAWNDNSDNELYYEVAYSYIRNILGDNTTFTGIAKVQRDYVEAGISSLEPNQLVTFTGVRAGNEMGVSRYYSSCTGTTLAATSPAKPTSFTASNSDPFAINLSWTPATSNPKADSFQIFAKLDNGTDKFSSPIATLPAATHIYKYEIGEANVGKAVAFTIRGVYTDPATGYRSYSAFYNKVSVTPIPYACSSPTNLIVQILSTKIQIRLTWQDNSNNETGFCIERSTNGGNFSQITQTAQNTTTYQDNGLSQNVYYVYRVRAYRSGQPYAYSGYTNELTTMIAAPGEPIQKGLLYQQVSSSEVQFSWTVAYYNADNYTVQRKTGSTGSWTTIATLNGNATSYSNTGLSLNTDYYYQIQGKNVLGSTSWWAAGPVRMMAAPSNLVATAISSYQINLTWSESESNIEGFNIEQATSVSGPFTEIDFAGPAARSYSNTGLTDGTTYWYRIRTSRSGGSPAPDHSSYSNIATPSSGVPTAPSNLTATPIGRTQINLAWTDNSSNETGFYIERAPSGGSFGRIATVGANVKTYSNTGVTMGAIYQYRVQAYNGSGNSGYSNTFTANTNLAQGKTASVSSTQSGNTASNGNDGNSGTRWAGSSATMPQWWKVDLGASRTLGEVEIMFEKAGTSGDCNDFKVETSVDNNAWTSAVDRSTNTNTAQTQAYTFTATGRYVRITINDAPGTAWASFFEFRVFGK